jgi:starch synthase
MITDNQKQFRERRIASSLCRFRLEDEERIFDVNVKAEVKKAFNENRAFSFNVDREIVRQIRNGSAPEIFREKYLAILNGMFTQVAAGDQTLRDMLTHDIQLSSRLITAVMTVHEALTLRDFKTIFERRIVLIRERPGNPTIFHLSRESTVLSLIGQGPPWAEIPSIYLGINIFSALKAERKKGRNELLDACASLLMVEERAIETGFVHEAIYPPEVSVQLAYLLESVIENTLHDQIDITEAPEVRHVAPFTEENRKALLKDLDARLPYDELNFDYEKNLKAIKKLERLARRYRQSDDLDSLRQIVRLLVAASGHDIHEIRNRANLLLERIMAPKEFDAPIATRFINISVGESYSFSFSGLNVNVSSYFLRIYRNSGSGDLILESELSCQDIPLVLDLDSEAFTCSHLFQTYGHYDFAVMDGRGKGNEWINDPLCNGRVNVMPDVKGQIILEIFTDIHGHTKAYWRDEEGHPGLLYNENGQIIRLGNLSDVAAHLEHLKAAYYISSIYLLGTQKRGTNREDWAPEASSPSPFSPMSLTEIEPSLGGEVALKKLVSRAHELDITVIVDIVPHINRKSDHLEDSLTVYTYDESGNLVPRSSTDGRYGSWNDGRLLNYRKFAVWEWLSQSINTLIDVFDIDGIRFDSAHAVPIMMKKNNYTHVYDRKRSHEEMVEGSIIVNDREYGHFMTTGFYDSACRDQIAVPIHYYLMLNVERKLREKGKSFFINIAECYWGHERFLTRTGLIPYNSSLFKICENIIHGRTDVREIYHIYDNYYPSVLPEGTELLGILGNHDERRALNTFGHRGLRAAIALTSFMHNIIMDYEGSAEGESWKVFLDNIYVNWNQFEYASNRSVDPFYKDWYRFHRNTPGKGYLIWANNNMVAAAMKFTAESVWIGAFSFADRNENISMQFDNPSLPIPDDGYYRMTDIVFSEFTNTWSYFRGSELKISQVRTVVSYTDRVKLFRLDRVDPEEHYQDFLRDSFFRLTEISDTSGIEANFAFSEIERHCHEYDSMTRFYKTRLVPLFWETGRDKLMLGMKRAVFHLFRLKKTGSDTVRDYSRRLRSESDETLRQLGEQLLQHNQRGALVFMSAEADPFSKSGGLANVVYELPRELARLKEEVYVISGFYRQGSEKEKQKMSDAVEKYGITYTGANVHFFIMDQHYEVGVHSGKVDGVTYFLLDHHEFFDGLYWGYTASEKLRRRIAFARACAEVITSFSLEPHFTFTNDAYIGLFNGIVRCDPYYYRSEHFRRNTFLHIVHNGGWQYFDAYERSENGFDLFNLFNLPSWRAGDFCDPVFGGRLNCMATGIRFADRTITVSPSYASQIEYACDGLERILHNVIGISNAIGKDFRQNVNRRFERSGFVERNYGMLMEHIKGSAGLREKLETRFPEILKGPFASEAIENPFRRSMTTRMRNKLMIQMERGFKVDPDIVLMCMIHRISEQKGFQLLLEASEGLFRNLGYQAIIGGAISSGDRRGEELAHGLHLISRYYPESVSVSFGFQEVSVPLLSSDIFCMPSMHEPGGISQLEAFASGCLVVARATGGLRDTVFPVQMRGQRVEGNGFLFSDYHSWAFYDAMQRARDFFISSSDSEIQSARVNAENSVYFWDRPARKYVETIYGITETIRILEYTAPDGTMPDQRP